MEEDEKRVLEVVEIVVRISDLSWRKDIPLERRIGIFTRAIRQVRDAGVCVIAESHLTIEQIQAVDCKGDEETDRNECSLVRVSFISVNSSASILLPK